ncbi:DUF1292 domain-containing protein [Paenibacillus sediminis]|uniref:Uncharacterized protein YrzB (UPF0473 family) n=1 Tax=Paenibacillus sediminis TaxID=664909 RepID=A0ABS4GYJ4_9BACL|nr:DUF1292 domain-containing protein [Paenibacillus sediminis]MBP1935187.1 uncharacterized protein YrzB (UPF0473 family) [Paenibacillus sediminis]
MTDFSAEQVIWTSRLQEKFGSYVELQDENGKSSIYEIVNEFEVGGRAYAVLKPENASSDAEIEIFKIVTSAEGNPELVTIDDDDEWEDVSELYDELTLQDEIDE